MEATTIVEKMMSKDYFSQWLGISVLEKRAGYCRLSMVVREEMCNGFGIAHGGITYSLADSALAFASNAHGRFALSIDTGISHFRPVHAGEILIAITDEVNRSSNIGMYQVSIENAQGKLVARFSGTVFFKAENWQ